MNGVLLLNIVLHLVIPHIWGSDSEGRLPCSLIINDKMNTRDQNRNFVYDRWPNGIVPYEITGSFSTEDRKKILDAMRDIESRSCVSFIERRPTDTHYVDINSKNEGCHASLGYSKYYPKHHVTLQIPGCIYFGSIQHELLHVLGFDHEHNRPDRDEYVKINWDNLRSDSWSNYFKSFYKKKEGTILPPKCDPKQGYSFDNCYSGFLTQTFKLPYDYLSVMHYKNDTFVKYPGYFVMEPKKRGGEFMGTSKKMTDLDHDKLYKAYKCKQRTTTTTSVAPCEDVYSNCKDLKVGCNDHTGVNKHIPPNCRRTCGHCT